MPEQITAWKCPWCGMISRYKANVVRHEKMCYSNPATRSCSTCKHSSYYPGCAGDISDGYYCEPAFWECAVEHKDDDERKKAFRRDGRRISECSDWEAKAVDA